MTDHMKEAEQHLANALMLVDSQSIRDWATTEHNKPLFLLLSQHALEKNLSISNVHAFAAFIVAKAIGLID